MFIHIGTIDVPLTVDRGTFFCPVCREQTDYAQKKRKRFIAVYFIPLIPIQDVDEFVKCRKCREKFGVEIPGIMRDAAAAQAVEADSVNDHLLRMMVLTMIADGTVDDAELAAIRSCYEMRAGRYVSDDELREIAAWADIAFEGLGQYARRHAADWRIEDKQELVRFVFLVATASGQLPRPQEAELAKLPAALELDEEMFRNLIEEAAAR